MPEKTTKTKKSTTTVSPLYKKKSVEERMRKTNEWKPKTGGQNSLTWSPSGKEEGTWVLRVLPELADEEVFFFHYRAHFLDQWHVCLQNFGERCPICEKATKLWNPEDKDSVDSTLAKRLFAKDRFVYRAYLIEDNNENLVEKLVFWEVGRQIHNDKVKFFATNKKQVDKKGIHYDPYDGRDILLEKSGKGRNSDYAATELDDTPSILGGSVEKANEILQEAYDTLNYDEVLGTPPLREDLLGVLHMFLYGDDENDFPETKKEEERAKRSARRTERKKRKTTDDDVEEDDTIDNDNDTTEENLDDIINDINVDSDDNEEDEPV